MLVASVARIAFGQGGPPMITDDPGTPGNGKWENNLAIAFEHRRGETAYEVPAIDLNYGLGEHIQLTLQTAPVLLKRSGHGLIGGIGGTEAAAERRVLGHGNQGFGGAVLPGRPFHRARPSRPRRPAADGGRLRN